MKAIAALSVILATLAVPACGQSDEGGWQVFCDAPRAIAAELSQAAPEMRQMLLMRHIEERVTHPEVRAAVAELARMAPSERRVFLADRLKAAGVSACPAAAHLSR